MGTAVSGVAILMGLNLLGALPVRLPSLDVDVRRLSVPPLLQARPHEPEPVPNGNAASWAGLSGV